MCSGGCIPGCIACREPMPILPESRRAYLLKTWIDLRAQLADPYRREAPDA